MRSSLRSNGLIENVYYKSETTLPFKADLHQENGFLRGHDDGNIALENGLKFHIDWLRGQKTGFFVDQRENRSLLEHYAKGRNVLNMFCYTGGFSVYALRGNAKLVHSVDSSSKAIDLTRANAELNFRTTHATKLLPKMLSSSWNKPVRTTTSSYSTLRHLPNTRMPCAMLSRDTPDSMPLLSKKYARAASYLHSAAHKR